ncbi:MAG: DUF2207 domain-containing protein [Gammaproteobacteria bacterium]|nr:DUF2207 domain-containing protein [Gammaproteobacteria bacterium]NND36761.1 DUF2207 domain-containing protein [Gammaproteobacteria bacterium]
MSRLLRAGFLAVVAIGLLSPAAPALAQERILRFDSDITINDDASLTVIETIEIQAEGVNFRRGILRDFPTKYEDRYGNTVKVTFDVRSVQRDGVSENYQLEDLRNGVRVRVGNARIFLDPGPHTYTITYRTTRQLGFFDDFDELYWNVTGTGWNFMIDGVEARVRLPGGALAVQHAAYTGPQGARGTDFTAFERGGIWTFRTTRKLGPYEGLTIAVAWPKGFVPEPTDAERARQFVDDNKATGIAIGGTLAVFMYYLFAWRRFGRDPEKGTIIPRFEPPEGLSPAATRFIRIMGYDKQAFSAALINMAVKGYQVIASEGAKYRLRREPGAVLDILSGGERRIAKTMFGGAGESILLDNINHVVLGKAVKKLRESLKLEYEKVYFLRNTKFFVIGVLLTLLITLSAASADNEGGLLFRALIMFFGSAFIVYLALHFFGDSDDDPTFRAGLSSRLSGGAIIGFVQFLIFAVVMVANGAAASALNLFDNPFQSLCFAVLGGINVVYFFLLKRPTLAGRKIMDEIEGFRMYLGTAEEERLNLLNPPEKTPELFEKYLPYALALDLENEWSEKFARMLLLASMAPGESGYRPRWYSGRHWEPGNTASFTRNLGSSLGAAVASSTTAPGSSSGSGGGGSSGGGGGGGGGGGW